MWYQLASFNLDTWRPKCCTVPGSAHGTCKGTNMMSYISLSVTFLFFRYLTFLDLSKCWVLCFWKWRPIRLFIWVHKLGTHFFQKLPSFTVFEILKKFCCSIIRRLWMAKRPSPSRVNEASFATQPNLMVKFAVDGIITNISRGFPHKNSLQARFI